MAKKYAFKDYNPEKMARVYGSDLSISSKHAIEICTKLNNKTLNQAKDILNNAINIKTPIEFRRFCHGAGHKKGMAAGKFPVKASKEVLKLVESLEANAQQKGLNIAGLVLIHTCANRAAAPMHYGRHGGRAMKRSHVEIIAEEREVTKPKVKAAKEKPKQEAKPKPAAKPEPKPEVKKAEEPKPTPKVEEKPKEELKPEAKPEAKPEVKKAEEKPAEKSESPTKSQEVKE